MLSSVGHGEHGRWAGRGEERGGGRDEDEDEGEGDERGEGGSLVGAGLECQRPGVEWTVTGGSELRADLRRGATRWQKRARPWPPLPP